MPKPKDEPTLEVTSDENVVELTGNVGPSKPEPKPGDPEYDWVAAYGTSDLYAHTFPNGTVVALKPFASIYSKTWLYKIRNLPTESDIQFAAIDRGSCDVAREVLESLDDSAGDPLDDLWRSWSASGTSHGDGDEGLTPGN